MAVTRIDGVEWRVAQSGAVTRRSTGGRWEPVTRGALLEHAADSALWDWLREQGVRRPSPSGTTVPETERAGARVRLDETATGDADALAKRWGCGRAEAIAKALREARGNG